ncbi:MAG: beta-lactamase [Acidobacteriales bacterium]|nr:beta-lactamase [Terriglobales bacterium]
MRIRDLAVGGLFLICSWMALAQSQAGAVPDDVPNAERIRAYVSAFNAGDEAMKKFLKENVAEAGLKQRSVEDRLEIYKQMRDRMKSLEIRGVPEVQISGTEQSVTTLMQTGSGEKINLTFNFDPQAPNKLLFLRVEDAGEGPRPSPGSSTVAMSESEFVNNVSAYLDDLAKKDEFSGVVLVARRGKPVVQKAYGFADKEKKTPNNMETKFNLGSMNKIFTRMSIDQLASQGKLSYDDKLGKFLPDYPNRDAAEKVTIKQLLTMRSGIGDFFGERFEAAEAKNTEGLPSALC